ncbi:MAG: PIG-L family deacetylase [Acidimicrobiia bacterium]|nr:MAG: PIG-L family deacetylase [Acidimicrobiia bacterium]
MATSPDDMLNNESTAPVIPRTVLTIGAHPDDAEFGAGASLARWAAAGAEITILVVTDGSKGSWNPDEDIEALVQRRRTEQSSAADVLGVQHCTHLGHVDGELEYSMELRTEIALAIRSVAPDIVLSHDPWKRYELHPDHRATGLAAVDGVVSAREPLALTHSDLAPHRPDALLLWSPDDPDHAEPMSDAEADKKLEALLCHSSQGSTTMGSPGNGPAELAAFESYLQEFHRSNGERFGVGPAEIFKKLKP